MVIENPIQIPPYVPDYLPVPQVTPFTFRDGMAYLERLEWLIKYINRILLPTIEQQINLIGSEFEDEINDLIQQVNDAVEQILNSSIVVQDPVVAALINDATSQTRIALNTVMQTFGDARYVQQTNLDSATAAEIADSASQVHTALMTLLTSAIDNESVLPRYLKRAQQYYGPYTGYRKRIVHNLVYMHKDWSTANSLWGSLFPQAFVIDDVANEIITISQVGIASVYDFNTGAYKDHCFKFNFTVLNQSAVIRYVSGRRYIYLRGDDSNFYQYDITTYPASFTVLTPFKTWPVKSASDFGYYNGQWTIAAAVGDVAGNTQYVDRGKFFKYDDSFNVNGQMKIDTMRYGGTWGGGQYDLSAIPKAQGIAAGPGIYAASIGGGWNNTGESRSIDDPFFYQGVRVYDSNGKVIADSLVNAGYLLSLFNALGYNPNHIEMEGVSYAYDKIYTLNAIAASGTAAATTGGFVIFEEFSNADDAIDMSDHAVSFSQQAISDQSTGYATIHPDGTHLMNLADGSVVDTVDKVMNYMRNVGLRVLRWYTSVATVNDPSGTPLPTSYQVEATLVSASTLYLRLQNTRKIRQYSYWWDGTVWNWTPSETDEIPITIRSGFAPTSSTEQPTVQLKNGVVWLQGGFKDTGLSANGQFTVGDIPTGYIPKKPIQIGPGSSAGNVGGSVNIGTDGTIQIRTGAVVGSYYGIGGISWPAY